MGCPIILKTVQARKDALSRQLKTDIVALNRAYDIIEGDEGEGMPETLGRDLEWLLQNDIAEEVKLAFYNPIDPTDIFLEKKYRIALFNRVADNGRASDDLAKWRLPEAYEFDVFVYFKKTFLALNSKEQQHRLKDFQFGWFDLSSFGESFEARDADGSEIRPEAVPLAPTVKSEAHQAKKAEIESEPRVSINSASPMLAPFTAENAKNLMIASYTDSKKLIGEFIKVSDTLGLTPVQWNYSEGLGSPKGSAYVYDDRMLAQKRLSPLDMLGAIRSGCQSGFRKNTLYLLEDFHYYLTRENLSGQEFAEMISMIKSLPEPLEHAGSFLVILAPSLDLPPEIAPIFGSIKGDSGLKGTVLLERYGRDLTKLVLENKIKPVVGRDSEIQECLKILSRLEGNNPLLVGKAGVGKTAIVEGLATKIVKNEVPEAFRNKRLFALNLNSLLSGTKYRGEFEKRLEGLLEEVMSNADSIIVFIDEIHTLLGMGSTEGSAGAENILKPYLARGEFPCIGATTYDEYKRHIEPDRALVRRFQVVDISEPNATQTVHILMGIKNVYEAHHRVRISSDAVAKCVEVSGTLPNQYFPGKAIKLLDSVCASVSFAGKDSVTSESVLTEFKRI
ncbi:AAA family ATPase [Bdellovibrionota bacterium FG-2]